MKLLKLKPAFKDYLWGGTRLKEEYGKESDLSIVAESWELSNHPAGSSVVSNGPEAGLLFSRWLEEQGKGVWGENAREFPDFPVLIKFIDACRPLSIQVHPDDDYARRVEGEFGKNEMWYILDCEPGSFLCFGVDRDLSREEFRRRIGDNTLPEVLNKVEVHKGDVFFIPAGTLHAVGAGILICEIQQNSNSTYRVYDYGRRGPDGALRPLHIDKAVDVSRLTPSEKTYGQRENVDLGDGNSVAELADCPYFVTRRYRIGHRLENTAGTDSFHSLVILEGSGTVRCGEERAEFQKGDSLFLPAGAGAYTVEGRCTLIQTTMGKRE